jgi:hypothetical protein
VLGLPAVPLFRHLPEVLDLKSGELNAKVAKIYHHVFSLKQSNPSEYQTLLWVKGFSETVHSS